MAHDAIRLSFKIDAYEPETIPMARLAEYMADLATMIGERANVHFVQLQQGCVQLVHEIEYEAYPKIEERVRAISTGYAPAEAMGAYRSLNKRLAEDNTFASYPMQGGAEILEFPGARAPKPVEFEPVEQPGMIDGEVIGVGGKGYTKNVPVHIDAGDQVYTCTASRALAKELGHLLLDGDRRFYGNAIWHRDETEGWTLKKFEIQSYDVLDGAPLSDVLDQLRAVPSKLADIADPWGELMSMRRDEGETH